MPAATREARPKARQHEPLPQSTALNNVAGWLVYPLGDLIGQLIGGNLNIARIVAIALAGGIIYRREIPAWFAFLVRFKVSPSTARRFPFMRLILKDDADGLKLNWLGRTLGATIYFNPLWMARHMMIIMLATHSWVTFNWAQALADALVLGVKAYVCNLPMTLVGNYIIQERLPFKYRLAGSSLLSALVSIVYALVYRFAQ